MWCDLRDVVVVVVWLGYDERERGDGIVLWCVSHYEYGRFVMCEDDNRRQATRDVRCGAT